MQDLTTSGLEKFSQYKNYLRLKVCKLLLVIYKAKYAESATIICKYFTFQSGDNFVTLHTFVFLLHILGNMRLL